MKNFFLLVIGALATSSAFSQSDSSKALSQGYFQQEAHYEIRVKLDDVNHMLNAQESIRYVNHSKVTLKEIWFHLWPNGYKNNETEFAKQQLLLNATKFQFAKDEERGYIDSLDFKVNGVKVQFIQDSTHIDIGRIILNAPLEPEAEITITTPFRVKIPSSKFSRLGHNGQQYQICQWYPKPAVFDSKGWHAFPYLSEGEFYSEFGSFRVAITAPSNYVIASSGDMVDNADEQERIETNIQATEAMVKAGTPPKGASPAILSSEKLKTVTYTLSDVHDFAWFADKSYHILKSQVTLPYSNRVVDTYCYFADKDAADWFEAPSYVNDAVYNYSKWVGDYPYKVCKAVDGALSAGAGMEYPTITIIASQGNPVALDNVIAHEVGHNWFYGILGSNEREYPWMDEGSNSYYEGRYMRLKYPQSSEFNNMIPKWGDKLLHTTSFKPSATQNAMYLFVARRNDDQALSLHSVDYTTLNYGAIVYKKTANIYNYLAAYMGQDKFDEMMQAYYSSWKFKHPQPEDFKAHVEKFNGKTMPWLFDGLLASVDRVNYKVCGFSRKAKEPYVTIRNVGQIDGPVCISAIKGDSVYSKWYDGFDGKKRLPFPVGDCDRISVNASNNAPDYNCKNDEMRTHGLFRKMGKVKLQFGIGMENPSVSPVYIVPTLGANKYNGFMLGAAIHNIGLLRKKLEYVIMPMYSFKNSELAGAAQIDYLIRPTNSFFRNLTLSASAERYALRFSPNYDRITAGFNFEFKNRSKNTKHSSELMFRHVYVQRTPYLLGIDSPPTSTIKNDFNQLNFIHKNSRVINPYSFLIDVQQGKTFAKASMTFNYLVSYNKKGKGLDFRLFAGTFLWKSDDYSTGPDVRYRLSGQTGNQDYMYNDIFFGRNEFTGLWSQQMTNTDGAFKVYSNRGQTWQYLATLNIKTSLPGKIPVKLYADLGTYKNEETDSDVLNYNLGAIFTVIPDNFEIYIPLLISNKIQSTLDLNKVNFGERIRFVVNLRALNPIQALRKANI
jgi:hypothetical protein